MEADAPHIDSWKDVKNSFSNGHIAHAYLLEGNPSKEGFDFSVQMLQLLFCRVAEKILIIRAVVANRFDLKNMSIYYG